MQRRSLKPIGSSYPTFTMVPCMCTGMALRVENTQSSIHIAGNTCLNTYNSGDISKENKKKTHNGALYVYRHGAAGGKALCEGGLAATERVHQAVVCNDVAAGAQLLALLGLQTHLHDVQGRHWDKKKG